jgi:Mg/Co/Ni transporter MgtE
VGRLASPSGTLVGIATIDDLLRIVAKEIEAMVRAIGGEQAREAATRR